MKKNLIIIAVIVLLIVGAGTYFLMKQYTSNKSDLNNLGGTNIEISNFAFSPQTLRVQAGDAVTITWTNNDLAPHIIVSDTGNELTSEKLNQGNSYSHIFTTAGTYNYHCSIHPSMKGQIIVG